MQNYFTNPKAPTLASTYDATLSSSTELILNAQTSYIVISAISKGIFLKWGATASSSSFDEFISADTTRTFITLASTVQFIEQAASAALVVVEK